MSEESIVRKEKTELGFWLYLMSDLIIFASLFATFVVLRPGTNGGASGKDIFNPTYALIETFVLLASSVVCGLMLVSIRFKKQFNALIFLGLTIALGGIFVMLEYSEFARLASEGNSWQASAFLSSFFTLVGVHGLHIIIGILWALVLFVIISSRKIDQALERKIGLFALFWHFLDLVWIFIFSIVYLIGGLS